MTLSSEIV